MDDNLKSETRQRIAEIVDLAERLHDNPRASKFERSTWLGGIRDRCQLLKNVLGVALGNGGNVTDTGSLDQYLDEWDKPSDQVAAEKGITVLMVEAVKNGLESKGLKLQHPADPQYKGGGWHNVGPGPLPADWEERIRTGQPLS